jgi:hypothetical protein
MRNYRQRKAQEIKTQAGNSRAAYMSTGIGSG